MSATKASGLERLYTVREVARLLIVSERTVWRLIANRDIEAHRINRSVRITPANTRRYLEQVRGE